ncbi:hypothetical protein ACR9E3_04475 [Actinomycetospora sp. C-140]
MARDDELLDLLGALEDVVDLAGFVADHSSLSMNQLHWFRSSSPSKVLAF